MADDNYDKRTEALTCCKCFNRCSMPDPNSRGTALQSRMGNWQFGSRKPTTPTTYGR